MYSGVEYAAEHFSTEVKYLEKMGRHEHIVRIYECFNDETHLYSILEAAAGNAAEYAAYYNLPISCLRFVMHGLARGLAHVHSFDLVHRDIKPENVRSLAVCIACVPIPFDTPDVTCMSGPSLLP